MPVKDDLESRIKKGAVMLNIGTHRQHKKYSCGAAALKIVLDSFGHNVSEKEIRTRAKTNKEYGTSPSDICTAASSYGYRTFQQMNAKVADIESFLQAGLPVIIVYQAHGGGHYAVVRGANNKELFLSDPAETDGRANIPKKEFIQRWNDIEPKQQKKYNKWLMVVFPQEITFVEAQGDNYDIGLAIGQSCKHDIQRMLRSITEDYEHKTKKKFSTFIDKALQFLPHCMKAYPDYVKELEGTAEGAELEFSELFTISCTEELDWTEQNKLLEKCTTIVAKTREQIILGHNEDYLIYPTNALYIVKAKQKKKPSFIAVGYMGSLAGSAVGVNSNGIAMAGNSICSDDACFGVLKNFVCRALIDTPTIQQGIETIKKTQQAIGGNYTLISQTNCVFIETTAKKTAVVQINDFPASHTNHFLSQELKNTENYVSESSKQRHEQLCAITGKELSLRDIRKILRSHNRTPFTICRHDYENEQKLDSYSTTHASIIIKPAQQTLYIANGNPCRTRYQKYTL